MHDRLRVTLTLPSKAREEVKAYAEFLGFLEKHPSVEGYSVVENIKGFWKEDGIDYRDTNASLATDLTLSKPPEDLIREMKKTSAEMYVKHGCEQKEIWVTSWPIRIYDGQV